MRDQIHFISLYFDTLNTVLAMLTSQKQFLCHMVMKMIIFYRIIHSFSFYKLMPFLAGFCLLPYASEIPLLAYGKQTQIIVTMLLKDCNTIKCCCNVVTCDNIFTIVGIDNSGKI